MKRVALTLVLIGLTAGPALAQGRGRNKQGVPPGHLPPEGLCRVWYEGVPPGRQPSPTSCYEAERIASRDRGARVVYGDRSGRDDRGVYRDERRDDRRDRDGGIWGGIWPDRRDRSDRTDRDDRRYPTTDGRRPNPNPRGRTEGRAVPRSEQYPNSSYPDARRSQRRGDERYDSQAFRRGYDDGVVKAREDVRDGDRFDPARHSWYRSADRGYNSRYGTREDYRAEYRRGFLAGYERTHDGRERGGFDWWPF